MHACLKTSVAAVLALGMTASPASAQPGTPSSGDSLRVWQSLWSNTGFKYQHRLERGDVGLGASRVKLIVRSNPEALREAEVFGRFQVPTYFAALAAAIAVGSGIGTGKREVTYTGLGVLAVSVVFDQVGYAHLRAPWVAASLRPRARTFPGEWEEPIPNPVHTKVSKAGRVAAMIQTASSRRREARDAGLQAGPVARRQATARG